MPRPPRICPLCSQSVRPADNWCSLGGVRHHLACAQRAGLVDRQRGRLPAGNVAAGEVVKFRARTEWLARLDAAAALAGVTRSAYVVQAVEERLHRQALNT